MKSAPYHRTLACVALVLGGAPCASAAGAGGWALERPVAQADGTMVQEPLEYVPLERAVRNWRLCILYPHIKDPYWLSVNYGMVEEARRLGVSFTLHEADGYPNRARQAEQIRACARSEADAIILGTVSFDGHTETVLDVAAQMPVIAVVNDIHPAGISAKAAVSWVEMGASAGRFLAERHPADTPPVRVAWFPGPYGAGWVGIIESGFHAAIAGSAVEIAGIYYGDTGRQDQILLVEQALEAHPGIDYIVGNGPSAEVAVSILRAQGLSDDIGIVSTYLSHAVFRGLQRGRILAAPTDFPVLQGRLGVEMAVRALQSELLVTEAGPSIVTVTPETVAEVGSLESLAPADFEAVFEFESTPVQGPAATD
ncbi:TMAO reductase system periplasmic protein TorT [Rhodobacteraceae bacterium 2376]|uniref:TMAO reductase system periplasmic protein TorT n=1 Tax=Rhabdonatronobacter sediminivivens TaxID=2743469 RepID=A0A7Z0KZF9_9RHOB|nr:TMAO reductase system periplasmic protein TorT [Rhabdonatronobacter sediminivivens]NYS26359.1 TMAO reductase system periplasmic protein TorT [Rhabdonatronobacter sediminivivens]